MQDLTAQHQTLLELGVQKDRIYLDNGLTGRNRARPGLEKLSPRYAPATSSSSPSSIDSPDARAIAGELEQREVRLQLGPTVYDPHDPLGRMFFNVLATFAEFEADLLSLRTREGMAVARSKGRLKGKSPKLSPAQQAHLLKQLQNGEHTIPELAELFSVSRATVDRVIQRAEREHLVGVGVTIG
ncbi:MAG: recombinase family protein [Actinomycetota bacterium]|nr:recombinase family protein [Actinomycetota bacterium]